METNVVSHSMAESFAKCRKQFEINHIRGLMPNNMPMGLRKGNTGHAFFEAFLKAIKAGKDTNTARSEGIFKMMEYDHLVAELIPMVTNWVESDWPRYRDVWEIMEVEKTYHMKINTADGVIYFPFTIDLLIRDKQTNKIILIDHKCLYDPYGETELAVLPQQPKYVGCLRALGIPVDSAAYNVLRTRKLKDGYDNSFVPLEISDERIKSAMRDQLTIMKEIRSEPVIYRTANSMVCKSCSVASLCIAEQNNEDSEFIENNNYSKNDYGYTAEELENGTAGRGNK